MLKNWWKGGLSVGKEGAEQAARHTEQILSDLSGVRNVASKLSLEMETAIQTANKNLGRSIKSIASRRTENEAELHRILRSIHQKESLDAGEATRVKSVLEGLKEQYSKLSKTIDLQDKQIADLSTIMQKSISPGSERAALDMFSNSPHLNTVPGILDWKSGMDQAFLLNKKVLTSASKNLSDDTAFLKEYLALKRNPEASYDLSVWAANPQNYRKLNSLMQKDKIFDIVQRGKFTTREKLLGITLADQAKNLGVGATVLAGAGTAISMYGWFDKNDPSKLANSANSTVSVLTSFKVSGASQAIVNKAETSLANISSALSTVSSDLANDPEKAAATYVTVMAKELPVLGKALQDWDSVIEESDDPEKARNARNVLESIVADAAQKVYSFGGSIGFSASASPNSAGRGNENIKKIQSFLKSRFNFDIEDNGIADNDTTKALQVLEKHFNQRAKTEEFSGAFVKPSGNIVNFDNLMEAYNRIKKY